MEINSLFDVLRNITSEKDASLIGTKHFSAFMVSRFLSMDAGYVSIASAANRHIFTAPQRAQEVFFLHSVPRRRVFLKYVKSTKQDGVDISSIVEETGVSDSKAVEIAAFNSKLQMARNGFL